MEDMAARKSRRRRYRNRGRFGFLFKVLSAAAVLAAIVLGSAVFFRVDSIQVVGNSRYTEGQIIEAAQVERGDNLFLMHKFNTERHILTRLPYVDSVSITRRLPAGLEIRVTECSAVVAIQGEGAWWVLSAGGKYLERADATGVAGLPVVTGLTPVAPLVGSKREVEKEQEGKGQSFLQLTRALEARGMIAQATSYDLTAENVLLVGYGGRFTLKLPMGGVDYDRETLKVQGALETLPENSSGTLDLTLGEDIHLIQ